ncbi:MAG: transporter substrate-binding domain-containing protein [Enhygromyxa sp.]
MPKLPWTASLLLILTGCAAAVPPVAEAPKPRVLELASTKWPPFTAVEGEPRVANELVALALSADAVEAEQTILPVDEWLAALRSGEVDGSAAVWWSEDRAEYLLFSQPYLENRLVLIGRTGADVSATSFSQLVGKQVGIIEGYAYGEALDGADGPEFIASPSVPDNVRALLAGELDYVLADALFAAYSIATHPQKLELVVGEHPLIFRALHFAVRKDVPDAQAIIDHFDSRVRQMLRDGSYNRILGIEWLEADVDGDGLSELIFQGTHAGVEPPTAPDYRVLTSRQRPGAEVEVQPDYIINGQRYDAWEFVPESFKVTGVGGANVGIGIRW